MLTFMIFLFFEKYNIKFYASFVKLLSSRLTQNKFHVTFSLSKLNAFIIRNLIFLVAFEILSLYNR